MITAPRSVAEHLAKSTLWVRVVGRLCVAKNLFPVVVCPSTQLSFPVMPKPRFVLCTVPWTRSLRSSVRNNNLEFQWEKSRWSRLMSLSAAGLGRFCRRGRLRLPRRRREMLRSVGSRDRQ